MNRRLRYRQLYRGTTMIELMVAGLLMAIGMMALVQVWAVSFTMTTNTDNSSIAYNLGRFALERAKMSGFNSAPEGSVDVYYDGNQNVAASNSPIATFKVNTNIVSDLVSSGTSGVAGAVPANNALRTVTITVTTPSGSTQYYTTATYMSRVGI